MVYNSLASAPCDDAADPGRRIPGRHVSSLFTRIRCRRTRARSAPQPNQHGMDSQPTRPGIESAPLLRRIFARRGSERFRVTLRSVSLGVLIAWSAALALATLSWLLGGWLFDLSCTLLSGFLLS